MNKEKITHEEMREGLKKITSTFIKIGSFFTMTKNYIDQQETQEKEYEEHATFFKEYNMKELQEFKTLEKELKKTKKLLELNEKLNSEVFELLFAQDNIHYDDDMIEEIQNNIDKLDEQIKELKDDKTN